MRKNILSIGVTALIRSLRIKWIGQRLPDKCIVAFWHSDMLCGWWVARNDAVALVSKSKDGAYLTAILTKWKYKTVRGSSSVSGKEALEEAIEMIRSGEAKKLVITPDGPKGPKELLKRGVFIAAKELDLPLFFLSIDYKNAMTLPKSWDKFQIPLPFSAVSVAAHRIDTDGFPSDSQEQKVFLEMASIPFRSVFTAEIITASA